MENVVFTFSLLHLLSLSGVLISMAVSLVTSKVTSGRSKAYLLAGLSAAAQLVAEWSQVATTDGVFDLGQALSRAALTAAIAVFTYHKITVPTGLNEKLQSINLNPFNSNGRHEASERSDSSAVG